MTVLCRLPEREKRSGILKCRTFCYVMVLMLMMLLAGCSASTFQYHKSAPKSSDECVVLVHGLRGSGKTFKPMQKQLNEQGYAVLRVDYPSTKYTIPALADSLFPTLFDKCAAFDSLHIVAHSMGAIVVRYYLQEHPLEKLGRVVLLSPPNHGTELINRFDWCAWFRNFNGPGGMQLAAGESGFVESLPPPDYPVGILMSSRSINPVASLFIPGKDDGRVALQSAKLQGMRDFKLIPTNHHVIMKKTMTINAVVQFLKTGYF